MNQNNVNLSPAQIRKAAALGTELLNTRGAVSIDGPMALSGDIQVLSIVLANLANGSVIIAEPLPPKTPDEELPEEDDPDIPGEEEDDG